MRTGVRIPSMCIKSRLMCCNPRAQRGWDDTFPGKLLVSLAELVNPGFSQRLCLSKSSGGRVRKTSASDPWSPGTVPCGLTHPETAACVLAQMWRCTQIHMQHTCVGMQECLLISWYLHFSQRDMFFFLLLFWYAHSCPQVHKSGLGLWVLESSRKVL